jgi:hypothetical protein
METINEFRSMKRRALAKLQTTKASKEERAEALERIGARWIEKRYPGMTIR